MFLGLYLGPLILGIYHVGIMEKKMETNNLAFGVQGFATQTTYGHSATLLTTSA